MTHSNPAELHELFNTDDVLFATAMIGDEAERFLKTDLGRYIAGAARQDIQRGVEIALSKPNDTQAQINALNDARRAKDAMKWLLDAINNGKMAEADLKKLDSEQGLG